jgi:hypothetical protein
MQRNTLFLNRGDLSFAQVAEYAGVHASGWSWSTLFMDVDLDGWEDILVGTGHPWDLMDADTQQRLRNRLVGVEWRKTRWEYPPLKLPNVAFRNRGDLTFEDATQKWGFAPEADISHGMATADLDGDGDQDVVVNRLDAPALVLRNGTTGGRIAIRLRGDAPNTDAIGSRVKVLGGAVPSQEREVAAGGLYLSHSDHLLTFATGSADSVTIVIAWRDGRRTELHGARPGRLYEITTASAKDRWAPPADSARRLFEDRTADLSHSHVEAPFDDYALQFLLPNTLSQLGPGITWADLDRDGDEDLLIPAGRTGSLGVYRNEGGRLRPVRGGPVARDDQTTILALPDGRGGTMLLLGQANYEQGTPTEALAIPPVTELAWAPAGLRPTAKSNFLSDTSSVGPLALADYDLDGDLDLFAGGRVIPGAYPLSPSSRLYRNDGGAFSLDPQSDAILRGVGMVSAALFSDVDGDADQDLLLAIEWGTIRLFLNDRGSFAPAPESWGLGNLYSRWNGVAAGDLDGDGRLDLVATSWGRNTLFPADSAHPLLLTFGAIGRKGEVEMLFARQDDRIGGLAPLNTFARVSYAIPKIADRIRTFHRWADATVGQALGPDSARTATFGATTMDHLVLLNRGGRFEAIPLPREAQFAPAFHAGVADYDGDGNEDVFLAQNFFATEISVPRYDAGRSLLLTGDGRGGLTPVPGQQSGLLVDGEQRGAAHADFNGDGRLDLVVSQNGAATRLFVNQGGKPGLRVRLQGPVGNPDGIGAQVRIVYGERMGPIREVHAGSGYWSQNGAVQVFGLAGTPTGVWVRFPGGEGAVTPVLPGTKEVVVKK